MEQNALTKKLQLKGRQLIILHLPEHMEALFPQEVQRADNLTDKAKAVLAFAENRQQLSALIHQVLPKLDRDSVVWFAYPKKSSKRYQSDITRDQGWAEMLQYDYEPVSQVALDEDWSALRFKPFEEIKDPKRKERMVKDV